MREREGITVLARVRSGALVGVDAVVVDVEVDMALGLPFFHVVGLPEGAVKESKVRVVSALKNSGYELPHKRITVNLAPADIRKEGAAFELPIAIGVLAAARLLHGEKIGDYLYGGELSLDGAVKPIRGVLPLALAARDGGFKGVVVPTANAAEAALVDRIEVIPVATVAEAFGFLQGELTIAAAPRQTGRILLNEGAAALDMSDVRGQNDVKNALEVAAAGGHNVLMCGPPGSGKTMLARRLSTILPPMDFQETLEVTKIYSVLGLITDGESMIHDRPFRAPHHTISNAGLVGGGPMARPGELSMAHRGVLFLDELPEFQKHVLEVLRQPLEEGVVRLARANQNVSYPCQVMLVAAMNPCRCGYFNVGGNRVCVCTQNRVAEYHARVSGPLLDRVDITLETRAVEVQHMTAEVGREKPSEWYRQRVIEARLRQAARFKNVKGVLCNAQMSARQVRQMCIMVAEAQRSLQQAVMQHGLSARAHDRILKMARTRADLQGHERIEAEDMRFAIDCRVVDRRDWLKHQGTNRATVQVFKDPAQQGVLGGGGGGGS